MHLLEVILKFAIVLGFMVLVHELGHFIVAKLCGVRVETFSIGFGPRLFGLRVGETDYRISALPLGGYVKMTGETPGDTTTGDVAEFSTHPRWQRVLIALAGPFANFILSFCLLVFLGLFHHEQDQFLDGPAAVDYVTANSPAAKSGMGIGDVITRFGAKTNPHWVDVFNECALNEGRTVDVTFTHSGSPVSSTLPCTFDKTSASAAGVLSPLGLVPRVQTQPLGVDSVAAGTPAERAGLKAGDQILRIDGLEPHSADPAMVSYLHDRQGAPAVLTVLRGDQTLSLTVTPEKMATAKGEQDYRLGFVNRKAPVKVVRLGFSDAVKQSVSDNLNDSTLILRILKGMFTRHVSVKSLSGPVGIAQEIDLATERSYWPLVRVMSSISLNLGIFNLLPIPILDGGMILFLLIESIIRRDVSMDVKERVYQVAFVCLILLAVFVMFNDITRLVHR